MITKTQWSLTDEIRILQELRDTLLMSMFKYRIFVQRLVEVVGSIDTKCDGSARCFATDHNISISITNCKQRANISFLHAAYFVSSLTFASCSSLSLSILFRMAVETVIAMAHAMGRILVLVSSSLSCILLHACFRLSVVYLTLDIFPVPLPRLLCTSHNQLALTAHHSHCSHLTKKCTCWARLAARMLFIWVSSTFSTCRVWQ
jgi:hypothetical protein